MITQSPYSALLSSSYKSDLLSSSHSHSIPHCIAIIIMQAILASHVIVKFNKAPLSPSLLNIPPLAHNARNRLTRQFTILAVYKTASVSGFRGRRKRYLQFGEEVANQ